MLTMEVVPGSRPARSRSPTVEWRYYWTWNSTGAGDHNQWWTQIGFPEKARPETPASEEAKARPETPVSEKAKAKPRGSVAAFLQPPPRPPPREESATSEPLAAVRAREAKAVKQKPMPVKKSETAKAAAPPPKPASSSETPEAAAAPAGLELLGLRQVEAVL